MDGIVDVPSPLNEPVLDYTPGSAERGALEAALAEMAATPVDLPHVIGGARVTGGGAAIDVVQPHAHAEVLGTLRDATKKDAGAAVEAALEAAPAWRSMSFDERASILLKAADLLAGPWRATRERRHHARPEQDRPPGGDRHRLRAGRLLALQRPLRPAALTEQPIRNSPADLEPHRPPAAGGLRLRGHPVQLHLHRRQPAHRAGAHGQRGGLEARRPAARRQRYIMRLLEEAGLPAGRHQLRARHRPGGHRGLPGRAPTSPGSTSPAPPTSSSCSGRRWRRTCRPLPLLPAPGGRDGRQGLHRGPPQRRPRGAATAIVRGAFEYQGQKCCAASRVYVPGSLWGTVRERAGRRRRRA